jgi:hypothetical protein
MKASPGRQGSHAATFGARSQSEPLTTNRSRRNLMSSKKQPVVRKASKKIAKPIVVRARDASTQDSGAIRFGNGSAPAILRK